jgi:phage tail sheath protein FI
VVHLFFKLAFNPNRAQRDAMYKAQVNPIVSFASDGPVVWGQKTLQAKPSAFDRVDVRRLFIVLEKAISTASKYFLFEKNTAFTRRQLVGMIDPFLRRVQGREGIYEFHVECSEINNTPAVIDANELNCDIYIQATKTAEFITLTFVATRTGVDFNEYIGKTSG